MSTDTTTAAPFPEEPSIPLPSFRREATANDMAESIAASRDFPGCRTPAKAKVRIWAGQELGVGAIASCAANGIRIENGNISASAAIIESVVERNPDYDWKLVERNTQHCVIAFYRKGELRGTIDYTMENAKTAGLLSKPGENWKKHPEAMLFAAAFRTGARAFCAGAFNGVPVYGYEELGIRVDEDGLPVESESDGNGAGNELCTRDQRQEICRLVEAVGDSMPQFMAKMGIRLLDELSGYEAAKEIKRLEKRAAKAGVPLAELGAEQSPAAPANVVPLTSAQQTIADGFDESRQPSTPDQRDAILGLAQFLVADENECHEMLVNALAKRNCRKLAELNHLQAAALIEALQAKIKELKQAGEENCPFDESPRLPGMN